jgi:hypothetical protein
VPAPRRSLLNVISKLQLHRMLAQIDLLLEIGLKVLVIMGKTE